MKHKPGNRHQQIRQDLKRYRAGLYSYLIWWSIGTGIGLLFAAAVDGDMKQSLAGHLQNGITYLLEYKGTTFTYFLKRCLCYTQLLLLIWCIEYFTFGYLGIRMLMLGRGFIYGFSQTAWTLSYGVKGVFLGLISYLPHNILFAVVVAWMEWLLFKNMPNRTQAMRKIGFFIGVMIPIIAWVEAYISQVLFLSCI